MDYNEFEDLSDVGHKGTEVTAPEDEFFHSIYISGKTRKNHLKIEEKQGKFQVRGVEYNLDKVHMIITHTKEISTKEIQRDNKTITECFSYKEGNPPFYGTSRLESGQNRICPANSSERATNSFCNACRAQIIVAGLYCNEDGSPVLNENRPIFVFIRGKGMKYSNVSTYLNDMFKMDDTDIEPLFKPPTEESQKFEKIVVNNKRFVTVITQGTAESNFGEKVVFVLKAGTKLADQTVIDILKVTKKTKAKFAEKFDWSKGAQAQASGYTQPEGAQPEGILPVDEDGPDSQSQQEAPKVPESKPFSFEDVNFDK